MKKVKRQAVYFNNFQDLCYINALGRAELITDELKKVEQRVSDVSIS